MRDLENEKTGASGSCEISIPTTPPSEVPSKSPTVSHVTTSSYKSKRRLVKAVIADYTGDGVSRGVTNYPDDGPETTRRLPD